MSYARKKTTKSITIGLSSLEGAAIMNNTFCLGIFLSLVYFRGLKWSFRYVRYSRSMFLLSFSLQRGNHCDPRSRTYDVFHRLHARTNRSSIVLRVGTLPSIYNACSFPRKRPWARLNYNYRLSLLYKYTTSLLTHY